MIIHTVIQEGYRRRETGARVGRNEYQTHLRDLGNVKLLYTAGRVPSPLFKAEL